MSDRIYYKKLDARARDPTRATPYSAGLDLAALEDYVIEPQKEGEPLKLLQTGLAFQLPVGTYGRLALCSGFAKSTGAIITAGVIDADYINEIKVMLSTNHRLVIPAGTKFVQMVVEYVCMTQPINVKDDFPQKRTEHLGFGSTHVVQ